MLLFYEYSFLTEVFKIYLFLFQNHNLHKKNTYEYKKSYF